MEVKIEAGWQRELKTEFDKPYFTDLVSFVKSAYRTTTCYPPGNKIFNAFDSCPFDQTKVVILGQDPYFNPQQANGLCFSVYPGVKKPPSLLNIFKEREMDLNLPIPQDGDLSAWAKQGVLLLNATLTVEAGKPGSHQNKGWEAFTDAAISSLNQKKKGLVYVLWGSYAQKKGKVINENDNLVIRSPHPSPLSAHRGFFGNKPFSRINAYLESHGKQVIDWSL